MKLIKLALTALVAMGISLPASAALIKYNVSDARNNNGNPIGHGLYTFGKHGTGYARYSIQDGMFIIDDKGNNDSSDDTATLMGTAYNGTYYASFNVSLSGFVETNSYKREGGKYYNPAVHDIVNVLAAPDNGDIDFFTNIVGSVVFDDMNGTSFSRSIGTCVNCGNPIYAFQFGTGANAKNRNDFGGSAWVGVNPNYNAASHWDFNLTFTPVPEPSAVALLGLGLVGLGLARRRTRA